MKDRKFLLFDLDGTLTDPAEGITASIAYALAAFGVETKDLSALERFIGPPLTDTFREYFGQDEARNHEAIAKYREFYGKQGMLMNRVYEGIEPLLARLYAQGKTLLLATSKPTFYAAKIMAHYGLDRYFTFLGGSNLDNTRTAKAEVIAWVMEQAGPFCVEDAVMIGDRMHDVAGARRHGMDSIGVLFGYGTRQELEAAGANRLAESVDRLAALLL